MNIIKICFKPFMKNKIIKEIKISTDPFYMKEKQLSPLLKRK